MTDSVKAVLVAAAAVRFRPKVRDTHASSARGTDVGLRQMLLCPRLGGPRGSGRLLRLRELIVKFAVAHRSDQNIDD